MNKVSIAILILLPINILAQTLQEKSKMYQYDNLNRLVQVVINNTKVIEYVYDDLGNRIEIDSGTLSLDDENLQNAVIIYPNPTQQFLQIKLPNLFVNKTISVQLFDVNGRGIKSYETYTKSNLETLNVAQLSNGVYLIRVFNKKEKFSRLFIKK